jgi:flagellar biogenesis protein FliO
MYNYLQISLSLGLVIAIIYAGYKLLKTLQTQHTQDSSLLEIKASIMVGPKEKVVLLKTSNQKFLLGVGVGSGQVRLIAHLAQNSVSSDAIYQDSTSNMSDAQDDPSWLRKQLTQVRRSL